MRHLTVGTDEAGLGPKLGPLVIASFACAGPAGRSDLLSALSDAIAPPGARETRLEVGDSKVIYQGKNRLRRLEQTVLATIAWCHGSLPRTFSELVGLVAGAQCRPSPGSVWYPGHASFVDCALPIACAPQDVLEHAGRLRVAAAAQGIAAIAYHADIVTESRLNAENVAEREVGGSKNTWSTRLLLNNATAALSSSTLAGYTSIDLRFDRAGGRADYRQHILQALAAVALPYTIAAEEKSAGKSEYRLESSQSGAPSLRMSFEVGADRSSPEVAWASMLAKYLREVAMDRFNQYYGGVARDLRPTAGYPEDAARWLADASAAGISLVPESEYVRLT